MWNFRSWVSLVEGKVAQTLREKLFPFTNQKSREQQPTKLKLKNNETMVSFRSILLHILLPALALACKCKEPTLLTSLDDSDAVFRGSVIRALPSDEENQWNKFVVQVKRVYEGCTFKQGDRVIVATSSSSASCGVDLETSKTYIFAGENIPMDSSTQIELGKRTKISRAVSVNACGYTREWEAVSTDDKKLLRSHVNQCPKSCDSGADCQDGNSYYCDTGKCVAYNAPCDKDTPIANCLVDPCTVSTCTENSQCFSNYCGGCFAIFVDSNGNRVCN